MWQRCVDLDAENGLNSKRLNAFLIRISQKEFLLGSVIVFQRIIVMTAVGITDRNRGSETARSPLSVNSIFIQLYMLQSKLLISQKYY